MSNNQHNPVKMALAKSRAAFWGAGLFSSAINILMLTGPLFMLQIYDRVLASKSVATLVALFALVIALYLFQGLFEYLRARILARIGYALDQDTMRITNKAWIYSNVEDGNKSHNPVRDLTTIRSFIGSTGLPALFDLPWVPFYLAIVFLLHIWLGWLVTAGALIVLILTIINELITKKQIAETTKAEMEETGFGDISHRNSEAIISMGMMGHITDHWQKLRVNAMAKGQVAASKTGKITSFVKAFRMALQSGILALGAYLAIYQEISAGTMIAASILGGRALGPIDLAIGNWKNFVKARQSYGRLKENLSDHAISPDFVSLPDPTGQLSISNVTRLAAANVPGADRKPILQRINFNLSSGEALGVIGNSGSGKSSLARLIVGLWKPDRGEVRLDGTSYQQWDRDHLGKFIGYLPQTVELFPGTIRDNIARFDPEISDEEIITAAQLTGVHDLITSFPEGYSTRLDDKGSVLSAGQAQRVALARAVLKLPPLVVLDEPNSNLDAEGDAALTNTITTLRQHGSTVIVMAHRPSAISAVNKLLVLQNGRQMEFGDKAEVLKKVTRIAGQDNRSEKTA